MNTLLLRISAPLQSWGIDSKYDTRGTEREPTKSGIIGMIASAMGYRREDASAIEELNKMRFGVRIDREGVLLNDFHTAHAKKSSSNKEVSYVTHRYYICDAVYLVGLESENKDFLEICEQSISHPVFPLFLGRRSCPPTLPINCGIRESKLEEALENEPSLTDSKDTKYRLVVETSASDMAGYLCHDVPVSFSQQCREFVFRRTKEYFINKKNNSAETGTVHDAFAEVKEYYVPESY